MAEPTAATIRVRAIYSIQNELKTLRELELIAREHSFDVTTKDFRNVYERNHNCFLVQKNGRILNLKVNAKWFEKFRHEIEDYISLLPTHEDTIKKAFGILSTEQKQENISEENASDTIQEFHKFRPKIVYSAIFAAYEKPLAVIDVYNIAINRGFNIKHPTIGFFFSKYKDQVIECGYRANAKLFNPSELFFKKNLRYLDKFIEALPDKREQLVKNFSKHVILPAIYGNVKEEKPVSELENNTPVNENIEVIENDEMIDAANVGIAILAYIKELKKNRLKDPQEVLELQHKYDDALKTIMQKNDQILSLQGQVKKLAGIIESNNKKIIDLNHRVGVLSNRADGEKNVEPTKFKMSEVAKITKLVKGGNGKEKAPQV